MIKGICKLIFWLGGWKLHYEDTPELHRCVMMAAPHTSNWDFVMVTASFSKMRIPYRFTIKKEWMKFPFGLILGPMGGIAIDRTPEPGKPKKKMVEVMADLFKTNKELCMVVTPEGTRKKSTRWKTGFYHVAEKAGVPIALGFVNYKQKTTGVFGILHPSGNMDEDLKKIMALYKDAQAKHPELYSPDLRYI